MAVSRAVKSRGKGQAETSAPDLPATDAAPGAEAAPAGHGDTTESEARGSAPAGGLGDQAPAEASTASATDAGLGAGVTQAIADALANGPVKAVASPAVSAELAAAAAEELQRLLRKDFEEDIDDQELCGIVLCVVARISLWRGGRFFSTGETHMVEPIDVTREQLDRILAEPAFSCTFARIDREAASE